jgi:hypothetical protein
LAIWPRPTRQPGQETTITVRYYHAPGADKTPTATYQLFDSIVLAKRRGD